MKRCVFPITLPVILFVATSLMAQGAMVPDPPAPGPLPEVAEMLDGDSSPTGDLKKHCDELFSTVKKGDGEERDAAALELFAIGGDQPARVAKELEKQIKKRLKGLPKAALAAVKRIDAEKEGPADAKKRVAQCRSMADGVSPSTPAATCMKMKDLLTPVMETYFPNPARVAGDAEFVEEAQDVKRLIQLYALAGGEKSFEIDAVIQEAVSEADAKALFGKVDGAVAGVMKANAKLASQIDAEELKCVQITNVYRWLMGREPLPINVKLCNSARGHSKDMKTHNFFDHDSPVPGKRTEQDRAKLAGTTCVSENIAVAGPSGIAAFWAWLESPGHHYNMLKKSHEKIGVGRFEDYWTENFQ